MGSQKFALSTLCMFSASQLVHLELPRIPSFLLSVLFSECLSAGIPSLSQAVLERGPSNREAWSLEIGCFGDGVFSR